MNINFQNRSPPKKWLSRVVLLLFVISLTVGSLAVPVSASETDLFSMTNVLDYCTPNDSGNTLVTLDSSTSDVRFQMENHVRVFDVDLLLHIYGTLPTSVKWVNSSGSASVTLTMVKVGDGLYRVYGNLGGYTSGDFYLRFAHSGTTYVEFLSFRICSYRTDTFEENAYAEVSAHGYSDTIYYDPSDTTNGRVWTATTDIYNLYMDAYIYMDDWRLYDFLEYQFVVSCQGLASISAVMGAETVPFTVSLVENPNMVLNDFYVTVRVDVRDLPKSSTDYPMVIVDCTCTSGEINQFHMLNVSGIVEIDSVDATNYWLQEIHKALTTTIGNAVTAMAGVVGNIFVSVDGIEGLLDDMRIHLEELLRVVTTGIDSIWSEIYAFRLDVQHEFGALKNEIAIWGGRIVEALTPDTSKSEQAVQEMEQQEAELEAANGDLEEYQRPDISQVEVNLDAVVSGADLTMAAAPLTVILSSDIFGPVIIVSLMFMMGSYVLFGKR